MFDEDFITEFYRSKTYEFDEIILSNDERKKKYEIHSNLQEEFVASLSPELQKMYYDMLEKHMILISQDLELTFKLGFKYGARTMIDVLND